MSKIGTEAIIGQIFKPIVTTFDYYELRSFMNNNTSVGVNNAVIFSIPASENGNDDPNKTSIWATDESGMLCPLSFPAELMSDFMESLERYERNTNSQTIWKVAWVNFTGESEVGTRPNINIKVNITYRDGTVRQKSPDSYVVYTDANFVNKYEGTKDWWKVENEEGYYLQGIVNGDHINDGDNETKGGEYNALKWIIKPIEILSYRCGIYGIPMYDESNHCVEFNLTSEIVGEFRNLQCDGFEILSESTIIRTPNSYITVKLTNNSYNNLTPRFTCEFIPNDNVHYNNSIVDSAVHFPLNEIDGVPVPYGYYIYIGLQRPDVTTDPDTDLSANNTPLYPGYGAAGWHNIGQDISVYSSDYPAYNGGANTVILDADFNDITCYVAIPTTMGIYDGIGTPYDISNPVYENITIKGRKYNIYTYTIEGEFTAVIY
jgi:hypothetical protein